MQTIIIGAGIVGLHMASRLKHKGHQIYILEKEPYVGHHTSTRNSGVIHAGIYYEKGSLKEKTCIEGNNLTYEWLDRLKIPYRKSGKWVLSATHNHTELESFFEKISSLPIPSPQWLSQDQVQQQEPHMIAQQAILIPSTGIVDAASYIKKLALYVENQGVQIITNCQVQSLSEKNIETSRGPLPFDLAINCAGLFCDEIANFTGLVDYCIKPCRGDYYLMPSCPIKRPIYHIPSLTDHGLGVHLTPTLDKQLLLGPNAFFIDQKEDYHHQSTEEEFKKSLQRHIKNEHCKSISPAYSGNRPKLFYQGYEPQGKPWTKDSVASHVVLTRQGSSPEPTSVGDKNKSLPDFQIIAHKNTIHLLGIESPGLTAAPALAKEVERLV